MLTSGVLSEGRHACVNSPSLNVFLMKYLRRFAAVFTKYPAARFSQAAVSGVAPESAMCKPLKTKVLTLSPAAGDEPSFVTREARADPTDILSCTAKALKDGHVVAVPTDTIYGLACLAQDAGAVRKIYDIKSRNEQKPLAICVGEIQDIYKYCKVKVKEELLGDLLPGPVTLVFERSEILNKELNPFTREFKDLWPKLAVVVDGGPIGDQSRLGSTVVDLSVHSSAFSSTVDVLEGKYGLSSLDLG
ncbi:yrdC domain-containing protein, mitochondrial isoform X3 [Entelurus aequoreus]|uniref:yrdC domain-containing protein, mitochondrial isoform X3 n=1 Tax=Entelurus aequoreus TaxID=161455 RepID=UPI002B1DFCCA|nr:yrdC domain-containing protein, mitochondrial isoform X3 [Entelurus aequoreus]